MSTQAVILIILMLLAGVVGGLINYLRVITATSDEEGQAAPESGLEVGAVAKRGAQVREKEERETDNTTEFWKAMFVAIAASLLVPLFLNMISSGLMDDMLSGGTQTEPWFVFFGFCLVAAISSKTFIDTITQMALREARKAGKTAEAAVTKASAVEKDAEAIREQNRIDSKAWDLVRRQLSGELTPEERDKDLEGSLVGASEDERTKIFFATSAHRRKTWMDERRKMARVIPIFEALIVADTEQRFDMNHAELGYALKDKERRDHRKALDRLDEAIAIRQRAGAEMDPFYLMNRAICRIALDEGYLAEKPSSGRFVEEILRELDEAARTPRVCRIITISDEDARADKFLATWLFVLNASETEGHVQPWRESLEEAG